MDSLISFSGLANKRQVEHTWNVAAMGEIDETFGVLYLGTAIALIMFGITILQAYFYYLYYNHDGLKLKLLVLSVWLLDTIHTAFMCHVNYYYFVSSLGHPERYEDGIWSLYALTIETFVLSVIVQVFYITRIYGLCRPPWKWRICCPIIIFLVVHIAFGLETISTIFINKKISSNYNTHASVIPFSVTYIVPDTMIAVALCILLRNRRSEVQKSRVNRVITNIIVFSLERFILSTIIAVIQFVTYLAIPQLFYAAALDMIYGKLIANSLLATLNSRQALRGGQARDADPSITDSTNTSIPSSTPVPTVLTGLYATIIESSRDDTEGHVLRSQDLEVSIPSDKK